MLSQGFSGCYEVMFKTMLNRHTEQRTGAHCNERRPSAQVARLFNDRVNDSRNDEVTPSSEESAAPDSQLIATIICLYCL